jgi:hypothetical protein
MKASDTNRLFEDTDIKFPIVKDMVSEISYLIFDYYFSDKNDRVFTDPGFVHDMRNGVQEWDKKMKSFDTSFEKMKKELRRNSPIMKNFNVIISNMQYFAHKCIRYYFFNNNKRFLQELFEGYEENVSTFSGLFDKNIATNLREDLIMPMIISKIKPDAYFDAYFIQKSPQDTPIKIAQKIYESYDQRMGLISENLNEIINLLDPILQKMVPVEKPTLEFHGLDFIKSLIVIYNKYNGMNLYKKYLPIIKDGFKKMPELVNNSIKNIEMPDQFKELRKRLVILGYLEFDDAIDRKELFYKEYKAFNEVGRRILLV